MNALDDEMMALLSKAIALVQGAVQGAGDLQRGHAISRSAPISASRCSPPTSRPGARSRSSIASGQADLQGAEIRAVPGGRRRRPAWRSAAAARSCCTPTRCRRMPRPISAWSNAASGWSRLGRLQARCSTRWPGRAELPQGPDAGAVAKVFETIRPPTVVEIRGRGAGDAVPAPDRRHHHEPRPAAGRRQGQGAGAGRGLHAARAADVPAARRRAAASAIDMAVARLPQARAWRPTYDVVVAERAGRRADRRRGRHDRHGHRGRSC